MTSYRLEEEKMGVMIQRLTGVARGERFYPDWPSSVPCRFRIPSLLAALPRPERCPIHQES